MISGLPWMTFPMLSLRRLTLWATWVTASAGAVTGSPVVGTSRRSGDGHVGEVRCRAVVRVGVGHMQRVVRGRAINSRRARLEDDVDRGVTFGQPVAVDVRWTAGDAADDARGLVGGHRLFPLQRVQIGLTEIAVV